MNRLANAVLVSGLALAALTAPLPADDQEAPEARTAQYRALMQEFSTTARGLYEAKSDEERLAVAGRMAELSPRFLELAERNPNDSVALDSLVQVVVQEIWLLNNTSHPGRGGESLEDKAVALVLQHHVRSENLGEPCRRMGYGFGKSCEKFLRTVVETNPHREVQGLACLRLAQFLNGRLRRLDLINGNPELATRYEAFFSKDYLAELRRQDRSAVISEIESLFERAIKDFGDIPLPYAGKTGETAKSELHEIRSLSIGKVAPEIEGEDQDGARFTLSNYRGKVVMLYFWSEY